MTKLTLEEMTATQRECIMIAALIDCEEKNHCRPMLAEWLRKCQFQDADENCQTYYGFMETLASSGYVEADVRTHGTSTTWRYWFVTPKGKRRLTRLLTKEVANV